MKIYLVRHGLTMANKEGRYRGWTDTPLAPAGRRQAEKVAAFLAARGVNRLFCSDLGRAAETARIIGGYCGLKPTPTPLLREMHFGRFEGLTYDEIKGFQGAALHLWLQDPFNCPPPGGESLRDVEKRVQSFLDLLAERCRLGETVAVVSHGGFIRVLLYQLGRHTGCSFRDLAVDNGSLSLLERAGDTWEVIYYNRVDHLTCSGE